MLNGVLALVIFSDEGLLGKFEGEASLYTEGSSDVPKVFGEGTQ